MAEGREGDQNALKDLWFGAHWVLGRKDAFCGHQICFRFLHFWSFQCGDGKSESLVIISPIECKLKKFETFVCPISIRPKKKFLRLIHLDHPYARGQAHTPAKPNSPEIFSYCWSANLIWQWLWFFACLTDIQFDWMFEWITEWITEGKVYSHQQVLIICTIWLW